MPTLFLNRSLEGRPLMSTDQTEVNPYASPQADLHASSDAAGPPEPKRFRSRLIPAAFLMIFGGAIVALSFALAVILLVESVSQGSLPTIGDGVLTLAIGFVGGLWIYSALAWWRRRWWRAVLTTILGYAIPAYLFHLCT